MLDALVWLVFIALFVGAALLVKVAAVLLVVLVVLALLLGFVLRAPGAAGAAPALSAAVRRGDARADGSCAVRTSAPATSHRRLARAPHRPARATRRQSPPGRLAG